MVKQVPRNFTADGKQIVQVKLFGERGPSARKYSYAWDTTTESALLNGEYVVAPVNRYSNGREVFGLVVGFGSDYAGELVTLTRRATQEEMDDTLGRLPE